MGGELPTGGIVSGKDVKETGGRLPPLPPPVGIMLPKPPKLPPPVGIMLLPAPALPPPVGIMLLPAPALPPPVGIMLLPPTGGEVARTLVGKGVKGGGLRDGGPPWRSVHGMISVINELSGLLLAQGGTSDKTRPMNSTHLIPTTLRPNAKTKRQ